MARVATRKKRRDSSINGATQAKVARVTIFEARVHKCRGASHKFRLALVLFSGVTPGQDQRVFRSLCRCNLYVNIVFFYKKLLLYGCLEMQLKVNDVLNKT